VFRFCQLILSRLIIVWLFMSPILCRDSIQRSFKEEKKNIRIANELEVNIEAITHVALELDGSFII
jgi:hypothetical protein